jgi:hypothetical protein
MNCSALFLLVPLLAGCGMHSNDRADGNADVTINADEGGNVSFKLPFMSGKVKLPEGAINGGNFDIDGVKMIPGGTVTGFNVFAADEGSTVNFAFKAPASPDDVRSYFLDQLKKKGDDVKLAGDTVTGKSKGGNEFTIQVSPAAGGSEGKIVIHDKD